MAVKIYFVFCVKAPWVLIGGDCVLKKHTAHMFTVDGSRFGNILDTNCFFSPTVI
jgi:hypothetical protein